MSVPIWKCSVCTLDNGEALRCCQLCDTPRPQFEERKEREAKERDQSRRCGTCQLDNPLFSTQCEACGMSLDAENQKLAAPRRNQFDHQLLHHQPHSSSHAWDCPKCTSLNPVAAELCEVCRAPRPRPLGGGPPAAVAAAACVADAAHGRIFAGKKWGRNRQVVGTLHDDAFQSSLRYPSQDPLLVHMYDQLGWHCIPYVGCYGDPYELAHPFLTLELPTDHLHLGTDTLPQPLVGEIINQHRNAGGFGSFPSSLEFYVVFHDRLRGAGETGEVNVVPHMWLFRDFPFDELVNLQEVVNVGIFTPNGIGPIMGDEHPSFERVRPLQCILHNCLFSPNNGKVQLRSDGGFHFHSFFSLVSLTNGPQSQLPFRQVVTFHVLPSSDEALRNLRALAHDAQYLTDLLSVMSGIPMCLGIWSQLNQILRPFLFPS